MTGSPSGVAETESPGIVSVGRSRFSGGRLAKKGVPIVTGTSPDSRYALSFTSGGLLAREAQVAAPIYLADPDWTRVREVLDRENLLQARTHTSGVRLSRELTQRLSALSDSEVEVIADGTSTERGHVLWAAACRRYTLIAEFAEEVLRERFLTLAGTVTYDDFESFYRGKAMWHEELDEVAQSSYRKLRQVLFRMMVEAGLLTKSGTIEPALLSPRVAQLLSRRSPSDIRFFPTRVG